MFVTGILGEEYSSVRGSDNSGFSNYGELYVWMKDTTHDLQLIGGFTKGKHDNAVND
jgi:hypothetical protein